jgi:hypothetical protein
VTLRIKLLRTTIVITKSINEKKTAYTLAEKPDIVMKHVMKMELLR